MTDKVYCYPPDYTVLRHIPGITDADKLDRVERRAVLACSEQGPPTGDFDLAHLRAIHRHLFQDIYEWAGEVRTVEISKGRTGFMPRRFIETGMGDISVSEDSLLTGPFRWNEGTLAYDEEFATRLEPRSERRSAA